MFTSNTRNTSNPPGRMCLYPGTCTHMHLTCVMFRGSFRAGMNADRGSTNAAKTPWPRPRISSLYTDLINIALAAAVLLARPRRPRGWQHSFPDETRIPTRKEVRVTPLHWRYCACCPRDGSTRVCPHVEAFAHCLPPVLVWRTVSCLVVPVVVCLFW
jgi:hypothetical protein